MVYKSYLGRNFHLSWSAFSVLVLSVCVFVYVCANDMTVML